MGVTRKKHKNSCLHLYSNEEINYMSSPLVSVIVTVYNGENYLCQALDSVIGQIYQNIEVIIVDDGSTDKTAELAKAYLKHPNVHYVFQENGGHAAALNRGVSIASGEFLSFIDHDDLWELAKLDVQLNAFAHDSELDVVFSYQKNFSDNKVADSLTFERDPIPGYMPGSMLIRTDVFIKIGYFDTEIRKGYFIPWFDLLRINAVKQKMLPDLLYHRRIHGENISICSDPKDYKDYFSAIRAMRRQRANEN